MRDYRAAYSQMSDDELSALVRQFETLVEEAKAALRSEFEARGRDLEGEFKATEAQKPPLMMQEPAPPKRARKANKRGLSWNWRPSWNWVSISVLVGAVFWAADWSSVAVALGLATWIFGAVVALGLLYRRLKHSPQEAPKMSAVALESQDVIRRVERMEHENRRLKLGVLALAMILAAYVFTHWNPPDRYREVDVREWNGFVALDGATGRLCKTVPYGPASRQDSNQDKWLASLPVCWKW